MTSAQAQTRHGVLKWPLPRTFPGSYLLPVVRVTGHCILPNILPKAATTVTTGLLTTKSPHITLGRTLRVVGRTALIFVILLRGSILFAITVRFIQTKSRYGM